MFEGKLRGLFLLIALIWCVYLVDTQFQLGLIRFGIYPRNWEQMEGVLLWPFLHANLAHISNNTLPLAALGATISLRSSSTAFLKLSFWITLYAGLGVWLLGRDALHVGASGLVFGYFGFILAQSVYDGRISSILISTGVILLFGGMIWGIFPTDAPVSWEGHLFGFLSGVVLGTRQKSARRRRSARR